ncbi:hypothetical protein BDZ45DRAFT_805467 [Acephala macrosclerotiorum]|nr:hypothetical protein BDZ45DRAFT_805467 [Acephala macrosclerotiorum]
MADSKDNTKVVEGGLVGLMVALKLRDDQIKALKDEVKELKESVASKNNTIAILRRRIPASTCLLGMGQPQIIRNKNIKIAEMEGELSRARDKISWVAADRDARGMKVNALEKEVARLNKALDKKAKKLKEFAEAMA